MAKPDERAKPEKPPVDSSASRASIEHAQSELDRASMSIADANAKLNEALAGLPNS